MRRLVPLALGAVLLATPGAAHAQEGEAGTAVMLMRISLPDTLAQAQAMGLGELAMRMTYATDGNQVAIQVQFDESMSGGAMDLSAMLFHAIWAPATDSVHVGIVLPPELAAQMGGGIGFRMDFEMPDSVPLPPGFADSLAAALDTVSFSARDLGRAGEVGGVACEEWEMITGTDTLQVCMAEAPAAMRTANRLFEKIPVLQSLGVLGLTERQRAMFGGRELVPLRMSGGDIGAGMQLELATVTTGIPDPSFFVLPTDLSPFPMEMLQMFNPPAEEPAPPTES